MKQSKWFPGALIEDGVILLLTILIFSSYIGIFALIPWEVTWLGRGDPAMSQLGWEFFRREPWHWPLGLLTSYIGGTSIVFSDSNPLVAILLKALVPRSVEAFQYVGIWIFLSIFLQGLFARKIATLFVRSRLLAILMAAFLMVSPLLLFRINFCVFPLCAHWVFLAILYVAACSKPMHPARRYFLLSLPVVLAVGINSYLFCIAFSLYTAVLFNEFLYRKAPLHYLASAAIGTIITAGLAMYVCGYFIMPTDVAKDWGFGFEQMNLNALLNPMGQSTFLKSRDIRGMLQIEGFMYIGFGAVLLIPGLFFPKGWTIRDRLAIPYSIFSLYIVLMFAMAILPQITFDNSILFNVPEFVRNVHIFNIFRANSRMFWAAYYILLLYLFLRIATADIPYKTKVLWLFIALCIQWADIQPMVKKSSEDFAKNTGTVLPKLTSPVWTTAAQRYKAIKMVPQPWSDLYLIKNLDYLILGNFAVHHGMTINAGRLGRYDKEKLRAEELQQISDLQHGHLDKDSLYVVIDKSLLLSADIPEAITGLGTADGYCVVAPNWFVGKSANLGLIPAKTAPFAPLAVGHIINFSDPNSRAYLGPGWHPSEQFGVWSAETTAVIRLQTLGNARFLKINGHVPPNSKKAPPFIIVAVNGITTMPLSHTNDNDLLVKLPLCQPSGSCRYRVEIHTPLVFTPPGPEGFDMRYIGFGLVSIALVK